MPKTQNKEGFKFAGCKIMPCTCNHDYQDKRYGKYNRVHNPTKSTSGVEYRCTVCSKEK